MPDTVRRTRVNRDIVLPPLVRDFKMGHLTVEQVADLAYRLGLEFGYEIGATTDGPNPFRKAA